MNLRIRIFIPLILCGVALFGFVTYGIIPHVVDHERAEHVEHLYRQLSTLSTALASDIKNKNYSETQVALAESYRNNPNWLALQLQIADGKTLYQIRERETNTVATDKSEVLHYQYPVSVAGTTLAQISLDYDLESDLSVFRTNFQQFQWYAFIGGIVALIGVALVIERYVLYPLNRLRKAAAHLAVGEFAVKLPAGKNDEVGDLIQSFGTMRGAIQQQQQSMRVEIADRQLSEKQVQQTLEQQVVLGEILHLSLEPMSMEQFLNSTLDILFSLPWLGTIARGYICVAEADGTLTPVAQRNWTEDKQDCANKCYAPTSLCREALLNKQLVIRTSREHATQGDGNVAAYDEMALPIVYNDGVVGIVNLSVESGEEIQPQQLNFLHDVTASLSGAMRRMLAERALRQSNITLEQRVRERTTEVHNQQFALDQHSIVAITDRAGRISYLNDKFCEISQYDREELFGQNHRLLNSGAHPKEFFIQLWDTISHGKVWRGEICNRKKDGSLYWVDSTIVPFLDAHGKPFQYIAIRTDITTRKLQEQQLRRARDEALAADHAKSEFLAVMSHEIRTPMNGMIGVLDLMHDWPLTAEQHEFVDAATQGAHNLLKLLNNVLDYSKIETQNIRLEQLEFIPATTLQEVRDMYHVRAQAKDVVLQVEIDPQLPEEMIGDPLRWRQIVINLVDNAIKFTEAGSIQLHLHALRLTNTNAYVRLEIQDSGIGIPADAQQKIFTAFTQADSSTTRHYGGTGLGLSIVAKLVELMGGKIGVISQPGQGSTFWVELPFDRPQDHLRLAVIN